MEAKNREAGNWYFSATIARTFLQFKQITDTHIVLGPRRRGCCFSVQLLPGNVLKFTQIKETHDVQASGKNGWGLSVKILLRTAHYTKHQALVDVVVTATTDNKSLNIKQFKEAHTIKEQSRRISQWFRVQFGPI